MDLVWSLMLSAGGLVLLAVGGDRMIGAASDISLRLGLSSLATGVVIVGLATSAPEIVLSSLAALRGQPDLAYANIIGSNIANAWLIAGAGGLILPLAVRSAGLSVSVVMMLASSVLWCAVTGFARLNFLWGLVFLGALAGYLIFVSRAAHGADGEQTEQSDRGAIVTVAVLVCSSLALPAGAHLLITGALGIAGFVGIGSDIVGLTLVAIGTSLPELAATIASAMRRRPELILGNVIGSNLFNILAAGGAVALIGAWPLSSGLSGHGNPVMLAAAVSIAVPVFAGVMIGRGIGALFLGLYIAYMVFLAGISL